TLCRDTPAVPFHYLLTDGQSHTGPLVFAPSMQSLERGENPFEVLLIETNTVILDTDPDRLFIGRTLYCYQRLLSFFVELQGIPDKVLKKLPHLCWIG